MSKENKVGTPVGDRVLVKKVEVAGEQIDGGIVIPDSVKETSVTHEIVSIGPGMFTPDGKTIPLTSKVGDIVMLPDHGPIDVTIKGVKYKVVREYEILITL